MFSARVEAEARMVKKSGRNPSEVMPRWGMTSVAENIAAAAYVKLSYELLLAPSECR